VNVEEFFAKLSEAKLFYNWEFDSTFGIIRGISSNSGRFCPITAVCNTVCGKFFSLHDFDLAGQVIGLNNVQCQEIINATDNNCESETEINIRKRLLSILYEEGCAA
jgi:hypothetical protein